MSPVGRGAPDPPLFSTEEGGDYVSPSYRAFDDRIGRISTAVSRRRHMRHETFVALMGTLLVSYGCLATDSALIGTFSDLELRGVLVLVARTWFIALGIVTLFARVVSDHKLVKFCLFWAAVAWAIACAMSIVPAVGSSVVWRVVANLGTLSAFSAYAYVTIDRRF